jgi:ABC-type transport system involved in multi-copper enzyme maturation permease subunit
MQLNFIQIIARQEWNSIFRSKIPLALYAVLLTVSLLATITGWQYVSRFNEQQAAAREEVHDHWMTQPNRHPHRVAHYGYLVFREKSPLSFFDFGLDSYVGNSVFLEAHRQNTVNMSEAGFSNGMLRFGELSTAMVLQVLVPLFIIFIGFHTVAGLKQNGVLKILLCQRASYLDILLGKTLGLTLVTWVLFLPLLFISLLVGIISLSGHFSIESFLRAGLIVLLYSLYFLVITILVVTVSAVSSNARNALMVLVLVWILFFIVIPKSAQTLGNSLFEAPDKIAFEHSIEEDVGKEGDSHNPDDPHFSALKAATLKKYGVDSIQALPVNYVSLVLFGIYGFYHGNQVISRQQRTIHSVLGVQKNHLKQIVEHGKGKPVGTTAYYPFFYTTNPASPWAKFSIGQRDVNPFTLKVKMLAIEGQLYDSELTNPLTLLVGNLDASFVFIFLFPLLIIAFTYNVISEEQENGVWKIVRTSTKNIGTTIRNKLLIRLSVVLVTSLLVFLAAVLYLPLPLSYPTFQLVLVILLYVMFWFLISLIVVSLGKSSSFNATTLVSVWIFLCILFPGIANVMVNNSIPAGRLSRQVGFT